jgi:hypothetical protein
MLRDNKKVEVFTSQLVIAKKQLAIKRIDGSQTGIVACRKNAHNQLSN